MLLIRFLLNEATNVSQMNCSLSYISERGDSRMGMSICTVSTTEDRIFLQRCHLQVCVSLGRLTKPIRTLSESQIFDTISNLQPHTPPKPSKLDSRRRRRRRRHDVTDARPRCNQCDRQRDGGTISVAVATRD